MTDLFVSCQLADQDDQYLKEWGEELQAVEADVRTKLDAASAEIDKVQGDSKISASCTFLAAFGQRAIITWNAAGQEGNDWSILLSANPRLPQTISGTPYPGGTLYHEIDTDSKLITFYMEMDVNGYPITSPLLLKQYVATQTDLIELITVDDPDTFYWFGWPISWPLVQGFQQMSGGHSASMTTIEAALDAIFARRGITYTGYLSDAGIPTYSSPAQVLNDTADVVVLSTGKTFKKSGTNLVEPRSLWTITGESAMLLIGYMGAPLGSPVLVWYKKVTTTLPIEECERSTEVITTTSQVAGVNTKVTADAGETLTPAVWWLGEIDPSQSNLSNLNQWGVTESQLVSLLDSGAEDTHVILDSDVFSDQLLSAAEIDELLALDVDGIEAVTYEEALEQAGDKPMSAATGYLIPAINFPTNKLRESLTPDPTYTSDINDSDCIDPLGKTGLTGVISAVGSSIDTVATTVGSVTSTARSIVNKAGSMVATLRNILDSLPSSECFGGFGSVDTPNLTLIEGQIKYFGKEMDSVIDLISGTFEAVMPSVCKVRQALTSLIFLPSDPTLECITKGLTNDLVNYLGAQINKLLPCIVSPLDYLAMINDLLGKVNGVISVLNGVLSSLINLQSQIKGLVTMFDEEPTKSKTTTCSSPSLDAMVNRIKDTFGI